VNSKAALNKLESQIKAEKSLTLQALAGLQNQILEIKENFEESIQTLIKKEVRSI